jgi:hypothetical protein
VIARRKIFLADAERAPDDLHLRRALHAAKISRREGSIITVGSSRGLDPLLRYRT